MCSRDRHMSIVVLRTARLLMRRLTIEDAPDLASVYADPEVGRFVRPLDLQGTVEQLTRFTEEWDSRGHGPLAIIEAETGEFVGRSGLHYWPQYDEVEVGWVLRRDRWGRGYATEAGRASLEWAFEVLGLPLVTAIIATGNRASRAVAGRLGMTVLRDDVIYGQEVDVFHATADVVA
jgi:RimJ/RimL family protein N-acetyltransferase